MANIIINEKNKALEINKTFARAAACFGSDEYNELKEARRDLPTFKVGIFKEICSRNGLICDDLFICGVGKTFGKRCCFDFASRNRKGTEIFALKYYETEELFVVWCLNPTAYHLKRTKLSLKSDGLKDLSDDRIYSFDKNVQYQGWGTEKVHVFKSAMIEAFIKQFVVDKL